jgi:bacteriocin biosynthesis cyclodehydratase domain-containing protein
LRRLWRDDTTVQLGLDPARAIVLAGVGSTEARLLSALDGTLDRAGVRRAADALGVPQAAADQLLDALAAADALDDGTAGSALAELHPRDRERLRPDHAALSLIHAGPGAADRVLAHRRQSAVRVVGAARVGAPIASLLAAAGVGHVAIDDPVAARSADAAPGGLSGDDAGLARERAATMAVRRAAPEVRTELQRGRAADLTVLTDGPATTQEQARLLRGQRPHLAVTVRETTGVVGPLVQPGVTACLRCVDLTRAERDPCWPRIAAQLAGRRDRVSDPCDVVLAAVVAAQAAAQALAYLDRAATGDAGPATVNGTLELAWPDWRWRRRTWSPHPACGCCWVQSA